MDWAKAFATTETTKLYLDDDQKIWIEVRNELSQSEQRDIGLASVRTYSRVANLDDNTLELNFGAGADRKLLIYLVDWNLADGQGKTIDISNPATKRDAVKNLTPDHYRAIEAKIDAHVIERDQEKKATSGDTSHGPTSF